MQTVSQYQLLQEASPMLFNLDFPTQCHLSYLNILGTELEGS